jgi:hypothetical protein
MRLALNQKNRMMKAIYNTNRNVTVDNWLTFIILAFELLNNGLTLIGTLRKNKPETPPEFLTKKKNNFPSTFLAFDATKTIFSLS